MLGSFNREQRGRREAACVLRPTEEHYDLINRGQRGNTFYQVQLNETWRLIHNFVLKEKG